MDSVENGDVINVHVAKQMKVCKRIYSKNPQNSKIQRSFIFGRRLQDVTASLQQGVQQPSELPMIGIVRLRSLENLRRFLS